MNSGWSWPWITVAALIYAAGCLWFWTPREIVINTLSLLFGALILFGVLCLLVWYGHRSK